MGWVLRGDYLARVAGPARWLALWLVLFTCNGILVPYFDNGPPDSWPGVLKVATGIFLAPGVFFWLVLFWHPFGGGPTGNESMFIILVNATVWLAVSYVKIWILGWLRGRRRGL